MDLDKLYTLLPKDPIVWTVEDIVEWLKFIQLEEFIEQFESQKIDGSTLPVISDQDLEEELNVKSKLKRKKILFWIDQGFKFYTKFLRQKLNPQVLKNDEEDEVSYSRVQESLQIQVKKDVEEEDEDLQFKNKIQEDFQDNNFQDSDDGLQERLNEIKNNLKNPKQKLQQEKQQFSLEDEDDEITQVRPNKQKKNIAQQEQQQKPISPEISHQEEEKSLQIPQQQQQIQSLEQSITEQELSLEPYEQSSNIVYKISKEGAGIGRHSQNKVLILDDQISRYHAQINFNNENKNFEFFDKGSMAGTFIRVEKQQLLQLNTIFEVGSSQFQVTDLQSERLTLTIIEGQYMELGPYDLLSTEEEFTFNIGRKSTNLISIDDDQHLSHIHAKIFFNNQMAYLEDMDSTNGTWLRLSQQQEESESFVIHNNMKIKFGVQFSYECKLKLYNVNKGNDTLEDLGNNCIICCEKDRDCLFYPCNHNSTCLTCAKKMKKCPICNQQFKELIKIYRS